ncbi:hypothetical protein AOLI_G00279500 [Acnodon oligacanthus]
MGLSCAWPGSGENQRPAEGRDEGWRRPCVGQGQGTIATKREILLGCSHSGRLAKPTFASLWSKLCHKYKTARAQTNSADAGSRKALNCYLEQPLLPGVFTDTVTQAYTDPQSAEATAQSSGCVTVVDVFKSSREEWTFRAVQGTTAECRFYMGPMTVPLRSHGRDDSIIPGATSQL